MQSPGSEVRSVISAANILAVLGERFPKMRLDYDPDGGVYDVLGDLAIHLRDGLDAGRLDEAVLSAAIELFNEMAESEDVEVKNLLVVGIFEMLTDSDATIAAMKRHLGVTANELFERVLIGWNHG